jgi:UDP-N-acetylmuramoyl-tripeptide--D-alanyl-D-alanine ligase
MEPRPLSFVMEACRGVLERGEASCPIRRVETDSRQVRPGDLFVALAGPRFDGHDFLPEVTAKGAVAALVNEGRALGADLTCGVVRVSDTRRALGRLAARYRADFDLPVLAVAGSNGKTTTKDLLATLLRERLATLASPASYNNDIGVPLTLLGLDRAHEVAVLEVGTNHPGELAPLVELVRPRFGILTSIGREHLEFFGDLEGVLREEGCLAGLLPADGGLFASGDDPATARLAARTRAAVVRVGFGPDNDWRVVRWELGEVGMLFEVETRRSGWSGSYRVNLVGRHQVVNAVLALAASAELGLTPDAAARGLAAARPPSRRLELWSAHGVRVLDDAYNANVDSMLAALQTLIDLPGGGRRLAVLGDMAEVGAATGAAHAEVGRRAAELGIDQLIAVGRMAGVMGAAARAAGLHRVMELETPEAAAHAVTRTVRRGDLVLVKASRATRLEQVSEALRQPERSLAAAG